MPSPDLHDDEISLLAGLRHGVPPKVAGPRLGLPPVWVDYLCAKWRREGIYRWVSDGPPSLGWLVDNSLSSGGQ
jgi:hypothetical protein